MLSSRVADRPVRQLHRRRRDERRRRRGARAADVPLRPAGLLLLRRRLPRRDERHPARRPTRRRCSPTIARGAGHQAVLPADGVDLAAAPPRLRHAPTCRRCARATTAPRRCRSRCCASCRGGCPDVRCGTSTARPRWRRWRPSCARTSSSRKAGSAGRAALNVETLVVDDDGTPGARPARSARSCTAARTPRWATTTTRRRPPRRSRGGWFHSGDLGRARPRTATCRVVDRKKDMIKTGGENVASREVEEADLRARRRRRGRRLRDQPPALGRGGHRRRRARSRAPTLTADDVHAHVREHAGRLQAAEVRRARRRAAEEPERQDPQARAARDLRRAAGLRDLSAGRTSGRGGHRREPRARPSPSPSRTRRRATPSPSPHASPPPAPTPSPRSSPGTGRRSRWRATSPY